MRHRLVLVPVLAALAFGSAVAARDPSPGLPSPPKVALTTRDEVRDQRFVLSIETDAPRVTTEDAIAVRTIWAHLGADPIRIGTLDGGPVIFAVEQLDGPFRPQLLHTMMCETTSVEPGAIVHVPFRKLAGYLASDPMAEVYDAWLADPALHLPAGVFRISAIAGYGVEECGDHSLAATVVVEVVAPGEAGASPAPSPATSAELGLVSIRDIDVGRAHYIEGYLPTVRIFGPDEAIVLDAARASDIGGPFRWPVGRYRIESWVESCVGSCQELDPPADACSGAFDLDARGLDILIVRRAGRPCKIEPAPRDASSDP